MSYKKDLAQALLQVGFLAPYHSYYGGWKRYHPKIYAHVQQRSSSNSMWTYPKPLDGKLPICGGWKSLHDVEETSYSVFNGTFADTDEYEYAVTAKVTCTCEMIKDMVLVYSGTMSELLQQVLAVGDNWLE